MAGLVRTQMADNNGYIIPHWPATGRGDTMEMSGTRECTVYISVKTLGILKRKREHFIGLKN